MSCSPPTPTRVSPYRALGQAWQHRVDICISVYVEYRCDTPACVCHLRRLASSCKAAPAIRRYFYSSSRIFQPDSPFYFAPLVERMIRLDTKLIMEEFLPLPSAFQTCQWPAAVFERPRAPFERKSLCVDLFH